jgi:hypothetical protein
LGESSERFFMGHDKEMLATHKAVSAAVVGALACSALEKAAKNVLRERLAPLRQ